MKSYLIQVIHSKGTRQLYFNSAEAPDSEAFHEQLAGAFRHIGLQESKYYSVTEVAKLPIRTFE